MAKAKGDPAPILLINDPHFGSSEALWKPNWCNGNGNIISLSPRQEWLLDKWEICLKEIVKPLGKNYVVVCNGDIIDGDHHGTKQLMTRIIGQQVDIAKHFLDPIIQNASKVYVVRGTRSHTGDTELGLADSWKDKAVVNPLTGRRLFDRLDLPYAGGMTRFVHHTGGGNYYASKFARAGKQLEQHQVYAATAGEQIPNMLVCAHVHQYTFVKDANSGSMTLPPFQLMTEYAYKVVPYVNQQVGMTALYYTEGNPVPQDHTLTWTLKRGDVE